jgi:rRNA small subunit pseudouridine methyltransferase Nep1
VHTVKDYVIYIDPETRLPHNYLRFIGLIENLFEYRRVPKTGKKLLWLKKRRLSNLIRDIRPAYTTAFSRIGRPVVLEEIIGRLSVGKKHVFIIGGFQAGHFSDNTLELADDVVSISPRGLDASIVTSRVIYEYERATHLQERK